MRWRFCCLDTGIVVMTHGYVTAIPGRSSYQLQTSRRRRRFLGEWGCKGDEEAILSFHSNRYTVWYLLVFSSIFLFQLQGQPVHVCNTYAEKSCEIAHSSEVNPVVCRRQALLFIVGLLSFMGSVNDQWSQQKYFCMSQSRLL